nr:MAG TPA: Head Tail Connector Protein [Caudoviricetes sp.]
MIKRNEVPPELLAAAENYLNITWNDQATDDKVCGLIASGTAYLDLKGGGVLDYEVDGMPRTLLLEYVRYGYSSALDVFETNYMNQILTMRHERLVEKYAAENAVSGE